MLRQMSVKLKVEERVQIVNPDPIVVAERRNHLQPENQKAEAGVGVNEPVGAGAEDARLAESLTNQEFPADIGNVGIAEMELLVNGCMKNQIPVRRPTILHLGLVMV